MSGFSTNAYTKLDSEDSSSNENSFGIYEPVIVPTHEFVFTMAGDIVITLANLLREE